MKEFRDVIGNWAVVSEGEIPNDGARVIGIHILPGDIRRFIDCYFHKDSGWYSWPDNHRLSNVCHWLDIFSDNRGTENNKTVTLMEEDIEIEVSVEDQIKQAKDLLSKHGLIVLSIDQIPKQG